MQAVLEHELFLTYKSYKDVEATNWAAKIHMLGADDKKLHCTALQRWRRGHENIFRAKICNCLNCDYDRDDHISISSVFPQFKLNSFHVSFLSSRVKMNSLNLVFIAQLVELHSANAEAMGSNPVEVLNLSFSG